MHVIFLSGIWDFLPSRSLGPYLLRHCLNKRGYSAQVIDHCQEFTSEQIVEFVKHFLTDETICLGVSTTFWQDVEKKFWANDTGMPPNMYNAIKQIKKEFPHIKVVLGGAGVGYIRRQLEDIDSCVVGEAEDIFPELLDHWTKGTPEPTKTYDIIKKKNYYTAPVNKTYTVESCDFDYTEQDCIMPGDALPMETARGCIFKCKFCAFPHLGKKKFDYLKPLEHIKHQMIHNYERWGTTQYLMMDDTFNDSEFKIDSFLEMTKSLPFKINYTAYIRADLVYTFDNQAEKLLESGLEGVIFGIESLHPKASTTVGKGWSGKHAREYIPTLVHDIWQDKVNVMMGFIAGLPGENKEDLTNTLRWLNQNKLHAAWSALTLTTPSSIGSNTLNSVSFLSEFDKNSESYGFKFDKNGFWYTDEWSFNSAIEFRVKLNEHRVISRINPWLAQQAKGLGYTTQELMNQKLRAKAFMMSDDFVIRKDLYIKRYIDKLLSLKNNH